jgi:hypothetical protein
VFDSTDPSAPPPSSAASARYVYLLSRLRGRQITMEEATELFSIMQTMIRDSASTIPPPPPPPDGSTPPPPPSPPAVSGLGADADWLLFLGLGMGAGLAAAMVKRMTGDPPKRGTTAPPTTP